MTRFSHLFSYFNQLRPFGWSFSDLCQEVFVKPWTHRQNPVIVDGTGITRPEFDLELCAVEYRKFEELVSPTYDSRVLFLAIDVIAQEHMDSAISQLGLSMWIPRHSQTTVCSQWHIGSSAIEMSQITNSTDSDYNHFDENPNISESDISELLRRELESVSREYKVAVVFYNMDKALGILGDKLNLWGNLPVLDARRIWQHKRQDLREMNLENCMSELSPHCHHLPDQPSAGNNAYHITRILATFGINDEVCTL
ncbi:hypothetical protein PG999_011765 [Apiospora kogelbergensis]|uniref:Uncharacterized protein n=1 Tax=Apiospora kogelbergensis TaxID=1337665 RepID=A0AAW0QPM9_9PEZI